MIFTIGAIAKDLKVAGKSFAFEKIEKLEQLNLENDKRVEQK